jgi:hypothetical protein
MALAKQAAGDAEESALNETPRGRTAAGVRRANQLLFAAIPANDRHRTAQQCQGTRCLTGVNLRRGYKAVTVRRFVIVRLVDTAFGEGEVCSERQYGRCGYGCFLHFVLNPWLKRC